MRVPRIQVGRDVLRQYRAADRAGRQAILNRVAEASGAHRKSVIRAVNDLVRTNLALAEKVSLRLQEVRNDSALPPLVVAVLDEVESMCAEAFAIENVMTRTHPHQRQNGGQNGGQNGQGSVTKSGGGSMRVASEVPDGSVRVAKSRKLQQTKKKRDATETLLSYTSSKEYKVIKDSSITPPKNLPVTFGGKPAPPSAAPRASARDTLDVGQLLSAVEEILHTRCGPETSYGARAAGLARLRLSEGATSADLLRVCQIGIARWRREKFPPLRSLSYLWGSTMRAILDGGDGSGSGGARGQAPVFREGEEAEAWARGCEEMPTATRAILLGPDR